MATLRKITLRWEILTGAISCDTGYIKRQELCDVDLYVTVDGTAYAFDAGWGLNSTVKPVLLGDNSALVQITAWVASATAGLYQATAQSISSAALDTYLAANNADTTDDEGNKLVDLDVYYTISGAMKAKSDTVTLICKPDVGRADDGEPTVVTDRNDFLVSSASGLLVNVAAGYAANGAFVAAQSGLVITNAANYIEITAAGVASVNTSAFTAGSYPLAKVIASAGAITSNTDLRAWITPKPSSTTLTANSTPTSGFTNGQALISDGTKLQALTLGSLATQSGTFSGTSSGTNTGDNAVNSLYSGLAASKADVGQTFFLGTTSIAINRASGALSLTGISAINALAISAPGGTTNISIGGSALSNIGLGDDNVAVGFAALSAANGTTGNVGIGTYAGAYATGNNEFFLNNQNRTNEAGDKTKSLLYGTFATTAAAQQITLNVGTFTISGTNAITLKDYALTANASGTVLVNGGALGTPSSGVGTNLTALTAANIADSTSVGRNILNLPALTAVPNYLRINTDGTVDKLTAASFLTAVGGDNASNLASGTVPDARFPATLPAVSGVNLTALNASNLGSGNVPDARNTVSNSTTTTMSGLATISPPGNVLSQQNGSSAQQFKVFKDASAWMGIGIVAGAMQLNSASGNGFQIRPSGSLDFIPGASNGIGFWFNNATNCWNMTASGHFVAGADNTYDIGGSSSTLRPRDGHFARNLDVGGTSTLTGAVTQSAKTTTYNGIATAGEGLTSIRKATRVTAQTAANASIATYTAPASDGSYEVSMNMNVTAVTVLSASLNCDYTDESNTARTMILPLSGLTGAFLAGGLATTTGPFETPVMHIRVKASTAITLYTSAGTYTGVTYTAEGIIKQTQ